MACLPNIVPPLFFIVCGGQVHLQNQSLLTCIHDHKGDLLNVLSVQYKVHMRFLSGDISVDFEERILISIKY